MSQTPPEPPAPAAESAAADAVKVVSGGGIVMAGGLIDRALRVLVAMLLAQTLSVSDFGTYQYVVKALMVVAVLAPMGQDISMVFFGARFRRSNERAKLKGAFLMGASFTATSAVLLAAAATTAIQQGLVGDAGYQEELLLFAPVIVLMPLLLFTVSCLRAFKDMRSNALAFNIVVPGTLLLGMIVGVWGMGGGVRTALLVLLGSLVFGLITAVALAWRHYGPLLRDRSLKPVFAVRKQLTYAVPQGLMGVVYRMSTWMDALMLGTLLGTVEVGYYSPAASLALLGTLPTVSLNMMFNPVISELVQIRELARLETILQILTRWLLLLAVPIFAALMLLPDAAIIALFGEKYLPGVGALMILAVGQAFVAILAPTTRIIPMSGYSLLNLINGLVAFALTAGLNYALIPRYGIMGAAAGTSITLSAWSLWRVVEVRHLLHISPFSRQTLLIGGVSTATLTAAILLTTGAPMLTRALVLVGFGAAYAAFVYVFGRSKDDHLILAPIQKRLQRLLRRK